MSLTGIPLLAGVAFAALVVLAVTVLGWRRGGRRRFLLRTAGVLLTEALVLLTVGLVVNRSEGFYLSWDALLRGGAARRADAVSRPGGLDDWLRAHFGSRMALPAVFTWRPPDWAAWHLTDAPTVAVPTDYLQHPDWRYPAVLVLSGASDGWTDAEQAQVARSVNNTADVAVLVFARVDPVAPAAAFADALPADLMRDLRVYGHSWAIVTGAATQPLARRVVIAQPDRFPALAVVQARP